MSVSALPFSRAKVKELIAQHPLIHLRRPNVKTTQENGALHLEPYWSAFEGYTKKRWIGREVSEVLTKEFRSNSKNYAAAAIRSGRFFINRQQMTNPRYKFRAAELVTHLGHRHEPPILDRPIEILHEDANWFVINKPAGLTVHPCGMYNLHSVTSQLKILRGHQNIQLLYRLDRTTSGLLIFALNPEAGKKFHFSKSKITKDYLAKVEGIFPKGEITCDAPIDRLAPWSNLRGVQQDGKSCLSKFRRISVDEKENTSLVKCTLLTGRTHQIRVHLQFLGFPIVDDRVYNNGCWGPSKGKHGNYGKSVAELLNDVRRHCFNMEVSMRVNTDSEYQQRLKRIADDENYPAEKIELEKLENFNMWPDFDPLCLGCCPHNEERRRQFNDFQISLHCWRYYCDDWAFEAPFPNWAMSAASTSNTNSNVESESSSAAVDYNPSTSKRSWHSLLSFLWPIK